MIHNAVRTDKKAWELIRQFSAEGQPKQCTLRCACGDTPGYVITDGPGMAFIAVCDACGDDNNDNLISIII